MKSSVLYNYCKDCATILNHGFFIFRGVFLAKLRAFDLLNFFSAMFQDSAYLLVIFHLGLANFFFYNIFG